MNLIYDDQQGKMYADIRDFNAVCAGDLGSDRTTLKLEAETKSLTYKMNGIPFLVNANISATMDVDADLANNKYTLKRQHHPPQRHSGRYRRLGSLERSGYRHRLET